MRWENYHLARVGMSALRPERRGLVLAGSGDERETMPGLPDGAALAVGSVASADSQRTFGAALRGYWHGGSVMPLLSVPAGAVRYLRVNANDTVSWLTASDFRTAIGAGTVNSVAIDSSILSVSGSPVTDSGTITLGLATSGSGTTLALVNSPSLTTPNLGTPSAGVLTNCSGYPYSALSGTPSTFAPSSHASSHQSGGGDAIKLDDLAAPDDNTDLDVSTARHGLTPKAPNDTTKFLRGDGAWAVPSGGVTSVGISGPSIITWSNSPVTSSGTLTGVLANQNANLFLAGPSSGSAAAPTFRSLVHLDLPQLAGVNECRLTLTTGTPAPTVDVATATTIYFTPYTGELVSIPDGTTWQLYRVTSELSLALGTLTSGKNYDVFLWDNSGTLTLALGTAWNTNTARVSGSAGEIEQYNGWWTNKYAEGSMGARRGRLLGTFRTISTTQTIDSCAGRKRFLCNAQNRILRPVLAVDTTDNWTYTTNTLRQANASATNQVEYVETLPGLFVEATVFAQCFNATACRGLVDIGVDSTSAGSALLLNGGGSLPANSFQGLQAKYCGFPGIGYHYLAWLEQSQATGTMNWYGDDGTGTPSSARSGILAQVWV